MPVTSKEEESEVDVGHNNRTTINSDVFFSYCKFSLLHSTLLYYKLPNLFFSTYSKWNKWFESKPIFIIRRLSNQCNFFAALIHPPILVPLLILTDVTSYSPLLFYFSNSRCGDLNSDLRSIFATPTMWIIVREGQFTSLSLIHIDAADDCPLV